MTIRVLKNHGKSLHDIGITYDVNGTAIYTSLTIRKPVEPGTKLNGSASVIYREYTLQVRAGNEPSIYYADHPYHEYDLAQSQHNTARALESAEIFYRKP